MPRPEGTPRNPIVQYTQDKVRGLVIGYCAIKKLLAKNDPTLPFSSAELMGAVEVSDMMLIILGQAHIIKDSNSPETKPVREITTDDVGSLAERFSFYKGLYDRLDLENKPRKSLTPSEERLRTCVRLLGTHLIDLGQKHLVKVEGLNLEVRTQS